MDESSDLYGREYWFSHQERQLGNPNILVRSRTDLPERCLYWLRTLLRYKHPPARVLEIGSAHGGFVAMLRAAGFEAMGLEVSPWVAEFARNTFQVPVLLGPIEDQRVPAASLDVIVMMDVLEHFHDPATTMRHCLTLLKPDGILLVQTPCYPERMSYEEMAARNVRRLEVLQPREHLHLFSRSAVREFFERLGSGQIAFEPPLFDAYDMFLVVPRGSCVGKPPDEGVEPNLDRTPAARMIQALLDLGGDLDKVKRSYAKSEDDRARRLGVIEEQGRRLGEVEAERNNLRAEAKALCGHLEVSEADRAARLEVIEEQGRQLGQRQAEIAVQAAQIQAQVAHIEVQEEQIRVVATQLRALQRSLQAIQSTRAYRLLDKLGCWKGRPPVTDGPPDACRESE